MFRVEWQRVAARKDRVGPVARRPGVTLTGDVRHLVPAPLVGGRVARRRGRPICSPGSVEALPLSTTLQGA